jgi:glycosyltransferase involved in cell wall biosynthesis
MIRVHPGRRLRLLEVNKFYPPHVGGVERVVRDLAVGFAERGHLVRVLACRSDRGPRRIVRGDKTLVIYARSFGNVLSMPVSLDFLILFLRLQRWANVVHWHEPFPLATLASLASRHRGLRVVTWHNDIVRQRCLKPMFKLLQRWALRRVDLVVPTSERLARFSSVVDAGSPKTKSVPLGVRLTEIVRIDREREENWLAKIRPPPRYGLFVGRLVYYKGIDVLLAACAKSEASIVLIGQGTLAPWVRNEIRRQGLEGRVCLVQRAVDDEELRLFYKHCAFLVLPSTAPTEAFGLVQIEVMAFGKPVINTRLPTGVPTVSIDGLTGITVAPNDSIALASAMSRLWCDLNLCHRLGEAARNRAWTEFESDRMVSRYLALFTRRESGAVQAATISSPGVARAIRRAGINPT